MRPWVSALRTKCFTWSRWRGKAARKSFYFLPVSYQLADPGERLRFCPELCLCAPGKCAYDSLPQVSRLRVAARS
jgi:hypothetical protein